jgi:restriction system protein
MLAPLLSVLAEAPDGMTSREAQDGVADRLQLSTEDRLLRVAGGTQVLFRHRTNWAHDRLKRAQLSSTPRKGIWQLTREGREVAHSNGGNVPKDTLKEIARAAHGPRKARGETATEHDELRA